MIVLIHADMELWDFIIDGVRSRDDFIDIPLNRFTTIIQRVFRKIAPSGDYPAYLVIGRHLRHILQNLITGDKVIISAYTSPVLFNAVHRCVREGVSVHLWMWNPIKDNQHFINDISSLKNNGFALHSFDQGDCETYGMTYHHSFYNMNVEDDEFDNKYDFYFLGAAKDRMDNVIEVQRFIQGHNNLFLTPSNPADYITYKQNIKNIKSSRCIVEILQNQQHDITLRPLEAIAFKRKLLTNNPIIRKYSFYNSNNIFVIGEDDPDRLDQFLNSPFQEIANGIIKEFDINTWINSF